VTIKPSSRLLFTEPRFKTSRASTFLQLYAIRDTQGSAKA
jgi:hypothetical protein